MKMKSNFELDGPVMTDNNLSSAYPTTFLDCAPRSTYVEVVEVPHGRRVGRRLAQVGILLHEKLRVRNAAPLGGPILVDAGGSTIAVGRSLASRIRVRVLDRAE